MNTALSQTLSIAMAQGPKRSALKNSPAIPGGQFLHSPSNNHAKLGFDRDANRVTGFGDGAGGMCIGNNREFGGQFIVGARNPRTALATIGWGVANPNLDQGVWRRTLNAADMPHKKAYDFGGLKDIP